MFWQWLYTGVDIGVVLLILPLYQWLWLFLVVLLERILIRFWSCASRKSSLLDLTSTLLRRFRFVYLPRLLIEVTITFRPISFVLFLFLSYLDASSFSLSTTAIILTWFHRAWRNNFYLLRALGHWNTWVHFIAIFQRARWLPIVFQFVRSYLRIQMRAQQLLCGVPDFIVSALGVTTATFLLFFCGHFPLVVPVLADNLRIEVSSMERFKVGELEDGV